MVPLNSHWVGSSLWGSGRPSGYCSAATLVQCSRSKGTLVRVAFVTFKLRSI